MPSEHVTKDGGDVDKIHPDDDPHVVEQYQADFARAQHEAMNPARRETDKSAIQAFVEQHVNWNVFNQASVDWMRFVAIYNGIDGIMKRRERGEMPDLHEIKHLWFPKPSFDAVQCKKGNAPADVERPKHLKGLNLAVDLWEWPGRCEAALKRAGLNTDLIRAQMVRMSSPINLIDDNIHDLPELH
jgi:hypothetical protein